MKRTSIIILALLVSLSMLLAACQPVAETAAPVEPAAPVVEPTKVVVEPTAAPVVQPTAVPQKDRVQIYWYIGLGAGAQAAQIPLEKEFVDKFNASQDEIQLISIIVDNKYARDNLTAQIAAGNSPDIVGPVGTEGRGFFPGAFLDLTPFIEKFDYDTSDIDPAFLEFYKDQGELVGLPFAIFPSAVFYNTALFDEAGLAYPPHKVGEKYVLDGAEVEWDFNTVAEIAKRLTVDEAGNDATSPDFDATKIVQYGFDFQWTKDSPRWFSAYFEPHYPVVDGKLDLSAGQVDAISWYYDAMWGDQPFLPTQAAMDSDLIKGNSFSSGKVAMGLTHLWYTCCIDKAAVPGWDVAVVPSYNGTTTAKMHGDTFAIMKDTKNADAAFKVYTYMLGEGSAELYAIYGGLPARTSQQEAFYAGLDETFAPNVVDWQVFNDMIAYLEVPGHELVLPNIAKAHDAFLQLGSDLRSNPDLVIADRLAQFDTDINAIFAEVAE
jgi:multiple sugar transport system substrate-binding protein